MTDIAFGRPRVLVIEDEQAMREILKDALAAKGFAVSVAVDGEEGLASSLRDHPDVIVLDILLPKLDGLTVLRRLAKDVWGKKVPVVVFTNLADASGITPEMKENIYSFLPKAESDIKDLVEKVGECIQSRG